jgi:serine/threonine-protein kinase HipA
VKELTVKYEPKFGEAVTIGSIHQSENMYFQYDANFLKKGLNLAPGLLKMNSLIQYNEFKSRGMNLHGIFAESLPDAWGLKVIKKRLLNKGMSIKNITSLVMLAYLGRNALGALTFHPESNDTKADGIQLNSLADEAIELYTGETDQVLDHLARTAGSPGGGRPKVILGINDHNECVTGCTDLPKGYVAHILKIPAPDDIKQSGLVEYIYSIMAKEAGLNIPETRILPSKYGECFAIERFDRSEDKRFHKITLSNLIEKDMDPMISGIDYYQLMMVTSKLTKHNYLALLATFQHIVFNVAVHNCDDHGKNFSYIMDHSGQWHYSPVYDLMYNDGGTTLDSSTSHHLMPLYGEHFEIGYSHLKKLARETGIKKKDFIEIVEQIRSAVAKFDSLAVKYNLNDQVASEISSTLKKCDAQLRF